MLSLLTKKGRRIHRLKQAVNYNAEVYNINRDLIASIIYCESRGEPEAYRFELGFFEKYLKEKSQNEIPGFWPIPTLVSAETEKFARATSWGLMQVMGQVARELGYKGTYLHQLTSIRESVKYGTAKLAKCAKREGSLRDIIARYNGDPRSEQAQRYATKVLAVLQTKQYEAIWRE